MHSDAPGRVGEGTPSRTIVSAGRHGPAPLHKAGGRMQRARASRSARRTSGGGGGAAEGEAPSRRLRAQDPVAAVRGDPEPPVRPGRDPLSACGAAGRCPVDAAPGAGRVGGGLGGAEARPGGRDAREDGVGRSSGSPWVWGGEGAGWGGVGGLR